MKYNAIFAILVLTANTLRMKTTTYVLSVLFIVLALAGCQTGKDKGSAEDDIKAESERLNTWFDSIWDVNLARYPIWQSYLGIKDRNDEWGDWSDSTAIADLEITKTQLAYLQSHFDTNKLDANTLVSYKLWVDDAQDQIDRFSFRNYDYQIDQMNGTHSWIPSFMINIHQVANLKDAQDYIARIDKVDDVIDQLIVNIQLREDNQVLPPKFVYPMALEDCLNIISGKPFDDSDKDNAILADFKGKVAALDSVSQDEKDSLVAQLEAALKESYLPGYQKLIGYLTAQETRATTDDGVWKFPKGDEYYELRLREITTTDMTPDEIYELGMSEIDRIHSEMEGIMKQVGFEGNLQEFFTFMQTDPQFYYSPDSAGRAKYLAGATQIIDSMRAFLPNFFGILPKADIEVVPVEAFREKSAGEAFYQDAAPDGSRPGRYYVNLYDMSALPTYEMEALAYHEGIPGHHMQLSIAMELEGLPKFRTLGGGYTAYVEGWGLYSEYIPKEYGFYKDPYSDFGRLSMELWRACRLVVDVGIHYKRWTRDEGIAFYVKNTPSPESDCRKMVERHIVMPGQATAYKIGQLKILSLLKLARAELGDQFDIREFHDEVLRYGAVPLNVLEQQIKAWMIRKKRQTT